MQSRLMSGVETIVNVVIGYAIATLTTWLVLPMFGYVVTGANAFGISAIFTVVSILRSYILRRLFNMIR